VASAGLEILAGLVFVFGHSQRAPSIVVRGKHLDVLEPLDLAFISFNKLATCVFTYHLLRFVWHSPSPGAVVWGWGGVTLANTLGGLSLLYVVYDLFYTLFHRALHHKLVYKYIHKHHHRQVRTPG
jgi:sterol desaturase/sphingolipid hydroxylase (fatty acid hydroxylase superfamily)